MLINIGVFNYSNDENDVPCAWEERTSHVTTCDHCHVSSPAHLWEVQLQLLHRQAGTTLRCPEPYFHQTKPNQFLQPLLTCHISSPHIIWLPTRLMPEHQYCPVLQSWKPGMVLWMWSQMHGPRRTLVSNQGCFPPFEPASPTTHLPFHSYQVVPVIPLTLFKVQKRG